MSEYSRRKYTTLAPSIFKNELLSVCSNEGKKQVAKRVFPRRLQGMVPGKRETSEDLLSMMKQAKIRHHKEHSNSLLQSNRTSARLIESSVVSLEGDESSLQSGNRMSPSFANHALKTSIQTVLKEDNVNCVTLEDRASDTLRKGVDGSKMRSSLNVCFDKKITTLEPLPREIQQVKKSFITATSKRLMTHNRKNRGQPLVDSFGEPSTRVDNPVTGQTGDVSFNLDNDSLFEMSKAKEIKPRVQIKTSNQNKRSPEVSRDGLGVLISSSRETLDG